MFTTCVKLTEPIKICIENAMTDWFNDNIELRSDEVSLTSGEYTASIGYDGNNCKDNKGTCTFKFREVGDIIEDFEITNVTGRNYLPFSERLQIVLRG